MTADRDPFDTLREALDRVSVSEGFADRVRECIAANQAVDLAPIEAELSAVSVSPEFAARVRERAAANHLRRGRWQWIGGLAAAAAIVLTTWMGLNRDDVSPGEAPTPMASAPSAPAPAASAPSTPAPRASVSSTPAPAASAPSTPAPRASVPSTPAPAMDAQFEVITTQPQILAELWAAATQVEATQVVAPTAPIETVAAPLEMDLATVEIAPVVVKWLVEPPPAMGFPWPIILRIAAAEAARRPE